MYNNAKRRTLSAWLFPFRESPSKLLSLWIQELSLHNLFSVRICNTLIHLGNFSEAIVRNHLPSLRNVLKGALAVSIKVYGSVDRFQQDNKHEMAKVVARNETDSLVFIEFFHPKQRGALGNLCYCGSQKLKR